MTDDITSAGKWGPQMRGNEVPFCVALTIAAESVSLFRYLELGPGNLETLRAVVTYLGSDNGPTEWEAHGVDQANYPLGRDRHGMTIHTCGCEEFLAGRHGFWNYVFISELADRARALREFQLIEPWVELGGVVCVRVPELLDGTRPGWRTLCETKPPDAESGALWIQKVSNG